MRRGTKVYIGDAPHECDEARRLRSEVRRLRRALREIAAWYMTDDSQTHPQEIAEAALARRKESK